MHWKLRLDYHQYTTDYQRLTKIGIGEFVVHFLVSTVVDQILSSLDIMKTNQPTYRTWKISWVTFFQGEVNFSFLLISNI